MGVDRIRIERGSGHALVICPCGWREMAFTEAAVEALIEDHKRRVHDDTRGATYFVGQRRSRERRRS